MAISVALIFLLLVVAVSGLIKEIPARSTKCIYENLKMGDKIDVKWDVGVFV